MTGWRKWVSLPVMLLICVSAGGLGAFATTSEIGTWYRTIEKPSWNPPDSVFGPVWTTLYLMMGFSAWLVWIKAARGQAAIPMGVFALQLILNTAWSFIFFGMHEMGWAFVEIIVLWVAIVATMLVFARVSRLASALLVPYLLWVSFASVLNFTIWRLNVA